MRLLSSYLIRSRCRRRKCFCMVTALILISCIALLLACGWYIEYLKRKEAETVLAVYSAALDNKRAELAKCKTELSAISETKNENIAWLKGVLTEIQGIMRRTYMVHQVITTYKKPRIACLSVIIFADSPSDAVKQFEAKMANVKAGVKIRSEAPVFAKLVFTDEE